MAIHQRMGMSDLTERDALWPHDDGPEAEPWKPLTAAAAKALRERQASLAPWRVLRVQAAVGLVVAGLAWLVTDRVGVLASALYGAAAVVLPAAVMVGGLARPVPPGMPALGAMRVLAWEAVKLLLAVGMLALAPRLVQPLSWPALLAAMVVCLKVYWLALLWRGR
jgi:ATP synthase protein I